MIRFLFRFVGFWVLAAGFVFLIRDGTKSIAANQLSLMKLGDDWYSIHPNSLQLLEPAITRHVSEFLWDPVMLAVLTAPTWLVLGILGALLMLIGRKKKPLIGYGRD
jgi:hypothetical protein